MNWLFDFFRNPFLLVSVISWFVAQVLKLITHAIVYKELDFKRLLGDGGMPSAHTATVSSLAALAGIVYGLASFEFAIAAVMTVVICRDAVGVRYETGKQAQILNEIVQMIENPEIAEIKLKEFVGHTPLQVMMGAVLGILVALVFGLVII